MGHSKSRKTLAGAAPVRSIVFERDSRPRREDFRRPPSPIGPQPEPRGLERSIEARPLQTALLNRDWRVLAVSGAWAREGPTGDVRAIVPGDDFAALARRWSAQGKRNAEVLLAAVNDLSTGRISSFHHIFDVSDRLEDPRYAVTVSSLEMEGRKLFTITRSEVSQLSQLAHRCKALEERLLVAREEERKRIGRDLHDSTSQLLVGLKLCVMRLKESDSPDRTADIMAEMDEILLDIDQEIRSISFLLHPPRLQGRTLAEAIRYMVRGFARRTGLDIKVNVVGDLPARMPEVEAALYRLVQEALANAFRHSAATLVKIGLVARRGRFVHLLIEDNGADTGSLPVEPGVGIESMTARISELGGRFSFRRAGPGCRLLASIPLTRSRGRLVAT